MREFLRRTFRQPSDGHPGAVRDGGATRPAEAASGDAAPESPAGKADGKQAAAAKPAKSAETPRSKRGKAADKTPDKAPKEAPGEAAGADAVLPDLDEAKEYAKRVVDSRLANINNELKLLRKNVNETTATADYVKLEFIRTRHAGLTRTRRIDTSAIGPAEATVELLSAVGTDTKSFVDIGCGRSGGNTKLLAQLFGWRGLMVDANEDGLQRLQQRFAHLPDVVYRALFVTPENINALIAETDLGTADFFSLDIDSFDYWVLEALEARPRAMAVEYNAFLGLEPVTIPRDATQVGSHKAFRGASLPAITALAARKGYRLVGVDYGGTNAFFVREDLSGDLLPLTPEEAWRGHLHRASKNRNSLEDARRIIQELSERGLHLQRVQ
jgi:hypothetical protein